MENHPEHVSNVKTFLELNNWPGVEYPAVINKNNHILFKKNNPEIILIVFYIDVDIEIVKPG